MSNELTICRMVHYRSYGTPGGEYAARCRASVITEVGNWVTVGVEESGGGEDAPTQRTVRQQWDPETCSLHVLNPKGTFYEAIPHDSLDEPEHLGGTWHWPSECRG